MTAGTVSVALITFNGERFVAEQLCSILDQTHLPDEIVVVDDGSTDGTVEIVRGLLQSASVPYSVHENEKRLGARANANRALGLTTGDLVALADQDDRWKPGKLERILAAFDSDAVAMAFSDADLIDGSGRATGTRLWDTVGFRSSDLAAWRSGGALDVLLRFPVVTGATSVVTRRLLERAMPIPAWGWHDMWLALCAVASGYDVIACEDPLMDYRVHDNTVGLRPQGPWSRLRQRSAGGEHREHQRLLDEALLDRLGADAAEPVVAAIRRHSAFLTFRDTLPRSPLRRAGRVALATARGDYRAYSRGLSTALADIFSAGSDASP